MREQIGGRTRLVKRASHPLLFGPSAQTGKRARVEDEGEQGEQTADGGRDSKSARLDHHGENEEGAGPDAQEDHGAMQDEEEDDDDAQPDFDPTAPVSPCHAVARPRCGPGGRGDGLIANRLSPSMSTKT